MNDLPKRKPIRIENYDYSTPGAYFITVCTANREKIFWSDRRGGYHPPAKCTFVRRRQNCGTGYFADCEAL